jgi:hypothetical protein
VLSFLNEVTTRKPILGFRLSAALIKPKDKGAPPQLWYAEAEALFDVATPTNRLTPLGKKEEAGGRHEIWFWQGEYDLHGFEEVLERIRGGWFPSSRFEILLTLRERPPVFLSPNAPGPTLAPSERGCNWLLEFWDDAKTILDIAGRDNPAWVEGVNRKVQDRLGIDLARLADRIGNVAIFVPTGVELEWHHDHATQSAVLRTNLEQSELAGYEVELETWEADELTLWRRCKPERTNVLFDRVTHFDSVRLTAWRNGKPVYRTKKLTIIKDIELSAQIYAGSRDRRAYSSGITQPVLRRAEAPWIHWPRVRRVDNARASLEESLELKFYQPQPNGTQEARTMALDDLAALMGRADFSVQIWDPYFGRDEADFDLLERLTNIDVSVRVLTSSDDWTEQHDTRNGLQQWFETRRANGVGTEVPWLVYLEAQLERRRLDFEKHWDRVSVNAWVRADGTAFHDRFLIVDKESPQGAGVWLLGSSLNGMGKKHSTLIKVSRPEEIIVAFDRLWKQTGKLPWGTMKEVFRGAVTG